MGIIERIARWIEERRIVRELYRQIYRFVDKSPYRREHYDYPIINRIAKTLCLRKGFSVTFSIVDEEDRGDSQIHITTIPNPDFASQFNCWCQRFKEMLNDLGESITESDVWWVNNYGKPNKRIDWWVKKINYRAQEYSGRINQWESLPEVEELTTTKCQECGGSGEILVEWKNYDGYVYKEETVTCSTCEGTGEKRITIKKYKKDLKPDEPEYSIPHDTILLREHVRNALGEARYQELAALEPKPHVKIVARVSQGI